MKRAKWILLWVLVLVSAAFAVFSGDVPAEAATRRAVKKPAKDAVSFTPEGLVANNVAFKITFADAVVSQKDVGKALPAEDFPFTVTPAIQAEGKWLDPRTFSATLLAPLEAATSYTASVKDGLGGPYTFHTAPLKLLSARAAFTRGNEVDIQLDFNIPVSPSRLKGFLWVTDLSHGKADKAYSVSGVASKTLHVLTRSDPSRSVQLLVQIEKGLTGETGDLGLPAAESVALELLPVLKVEDVGVYWSRGTVSVVTNFTVNVDEIADFIEIEPKIPFTLEYYYSGRFHIHGDFKPRGRYVFKFKKGMPSEQNGVVLPEDYSQALIMPDLAASIAFPEAGMYLSPADGSRIPIELTNVRRLQVSLWRLYENNIPYAARDGYYVSDYGEGVSFERTLARRVASREYPVSLPLNETVRRGISLDELISGDRAGNRGLFLLTVSNSDGDYWNESSQIVNLSDMGVVARLWEDGMLVWVNTLSGLEPVADADVRVYSSAAQLLAEGKTDSDGIWQLQRGSVWEKGDDLLPFLATVTKGQDVTFVKLTRGLLSRESFDTSGRPWLREGYDAALLSARDIYRTAERASFKAVVRNHDLSTPEPFPVLFTVRDSLTRTVKQGTALLSEEGGALFDFDIPGGALTGGWEVELSVPGGEVLARYSFSVEDFAPPRIEVKLTSDSETLSAGEDNDFSLSAKYLFGVDGAGLGWQGAWSASEGVFTPKSAKWAGYTFRDETRSFSPVSEEIEDGRLGEDGTTEFSVSLPDDWRGSVIDVSVRAGVMEEGGRWVSSSVTLPFYPSPLILGLAASGETLAVGKDLTFRVAAVTPDEKPAEPGDLYATLYRVTWNYNLVKVDGYTRWQSSEEHKKIETKPVEVKDGVGDVSFTTNRWGEYIVRVANDEDTVSASIRFYSDDPEYAERGSQLLDRVEIDMDKETYKVGDVAKVTLRAPFEGLLLFNVEAMSALSRQIVKVSKADTVIEVPVTEQMIPNAWCAAWLIRPVTGEEAWSTHRAAGIKRLWVDTGDFRLSVQLDAPEKIEPSVKLPVTVTLTDAQGRPAKGEVALALVDDGVLGLTHFKTPNLLNHFLGQRRMNSNGYDIYDLLMPIESKGTELLHPAGGALMEAYAGAAKAQRFKILSLFEGLLSADETGVAKAELTLPEFSGRGRLFAVAASGARFGSAEQMVQIARDIVTEADLPRFAAPGDVFSASISVFNTAEEPREIAVELSASEELSMPQQDILQQGRLLATVPAKGSHNWSVSLKAVKPGAAAYTVKTLWREKDEEKSYEQRIDMPVRSPYPAVTLSGSGLFESGDVKVAIPRAFDGAVTGKLILSDTPLVDLTKAVSYLTYYPHGCLEQTLSSAWPFLVLPDAISEIDPLLVNSDAVQRKTGYAMSRIQSMQLYDGSFSKWPGERNPYNWVSVHAAHFLTEARKAGVVYPEEMYKGALNWLKQFLSSLPRSGGSAYWERDDFTSKAYAVYVLALSGEKPLGWIHYLEENADGMWPSGRIWLAGARALIEGRADALRRLAWSGGAPLPREALNETLESDVRNAAQLLSIWAEIEPKAPEAVRLVEFLLDAGRKNQWYSTQENAAVTMALARYLVRSGYEKGRLEGALTDGGGQAVVSFRSGEKTSVGVADLPDSPLTLRTAGSGSGYYAWSVTGTPAEAPKPVRQGLSVETKWECDTDEDGSIPQGSQVFVILTVTPQTPVSDVALSCLLPAGMELENPRLSNEGRTEESGYAVFDVRDDRLILFIDRLSEKTAYHFSMRAVTKGTFAVPPVAAEGMYDPEVRFVGEQRPDITIVGSEQFEAR